METRIECDSMGEVAVPANKYWGAQTQRSLANFRIGIELMPIELIQALAYIKKAAALTNRNLGRLDNRRCEIIGIVCDEILAGELNAHFPLAVWQTGSGTQTNMNVNEVVAQRGNEIAKEKLFHPNDHVNMSQSSNDVFPSAMHLAAVMQVEQELIPALDMLTNALRQLEENSLGIIKTGRTHLQDAVPIAFSQEISGWRTSLEKDGEMVMSALEPLRELALGGTAVGTGLNAPVGFANRVAEQVSVLTGFAFSSAENKFQALSSKAPLVSVHGALKALAADLMKIANDVRWLASGPRCGLFEIILPANEPGSSIMPGKVNPTQCEALTMLAVQVMGNDTAVGMAASQGNFQLNVFMPVIIYNFMQSVRLLGDGMRSFAEHCINGITVNRDTMRENLHRSLMLVTVLNPYIGYDKAARVAKKAYAENKSLRQACTEMGFLTAEQFDELFVPEKMI